jgi:hypothetical protein
LGIQTSTSQLGPTR